MTALPGSTKLRDDCAAAREVAPGLIVVLSGKVEVAQRSGIQVQIDATTRKIEVERAELVTLARIIWTEPSSFLVLAARAP